MEDLNNKVDNGGATADGVLAATEFNQLTTEIQSIIESTGQTLAIGTLTQLGDAIAAMTQGDSYFGTDTGSSIAYVVAAVNTVHSGAEVGLFTGMHCRFRPANTSTSTNPTLNAFGSGVKNILGEAGAALAIGDLATTRDVECRYDGTQWILLDRSKALIVANLYPKGWINSYGYSVGVDADHDTNFGNGECSARGGAFNLDHSSGTVVKQIDNNYAFGTNFGGFPSALTLAANTWYRLFVIGGAAATTDFGYDTSSTAINLLSDATADTGNTYDKERQIGWVRTDASLNIRRYFFQEDSYTNVIWVEDDNVETDTNHATTTRVVRTCDFAPPNSIGILSHTLNWNNDASATAYFYVASMKNGNYAPTSTFNTFQSIKATGSPNNEHNVILEVGIDGNNQYSWRSSYQGTGSDFLIIATIGFKFARDAIT